MSRDTFGIVYSNIDIYLYYGGQTLRSFVKEVTSIKLAKDRMNSAVRIQLVFVYGVEEVYTSNFNIEMTNIGNIRNTRDFGMTRLWSGVGGFVGIFLELSLFQLVEIVLNKALMFVNDTKLRDYQTKCM